MKNSILLALLLLVGCGGGGSETPVPISIYGDSYTATTPSTADQITKFSAGDLQVTSWSVGGASTENARTGMWGDLVPPFKTFADQMNGIDQSKYVALRYGIAEVFKQPDIALFEKNLNEFVAEIKGANKIPVMINMVAIPESAVVTPERETQLAAYNTVIERVARQQNVLLCDIRSLVTITPSMMYEDGLHPSPATTYLINQYLAVALVKLVE